MMKASILKNGISVLCYEMPNTHSLTLGLYIRAGSGYKTEFVAGITHLLEHMHFRRIGNISQNNLYYKMESIGSTLKATTYRNFVQFTIKILPCYMQDALEIFCQLIEAYEWSDEELTKEKQVVLNQIYERASYISVDKIVHEAVFRDHNLSNEIMGTENDVYKIGIDDIKKYKSEIFNSENLLFCVTGKIDDLEFEHLEKQLEELYISKKKDRNIMEYPKFFHCRKPEIRFVPIEGDNIIDLNISFDVSYDKNDRELLVILNCILGEGVGSKLQTIIREERGYTSNISSYIEWYENFAVLHIQCSVSKKQLLPCIKTIVEILQEMKSAIGKRDLDISLPFYTSNRIFYEDDTEEMNFQLAYHKFVLNSEFGEFKIANDTDTIILLKQLSNTLFEKKNMCIVMVGNVKGITKKSIKNIIDRQEK